MDQIDYADVLPLAETVANLQYSEFWGTNEGVTWEDVQNLQAVAAYAIATGYCYHQDVKSMLLTMLHEESSGYDGNPEETVAQARSCLAALQAFESVHSEEYQHHDLVEQVFHSIGGDRQQGDWRSRFTRVDVENAIEKGVNYAELVKMPLLAKAGESPGAAAVVADILQRLDGYESRHPQKTSVLGHLQALKEQAARTAQDAPKPDRPKTQGAEI